MGGAQGRLHQRYGVVEYQRHAEAEQRRFRITQGIDLTVEVHGQFLKSRFDRPPAAVQCGDVASADAPHSTRREVAQQVDHVVPVSGGMVQVDFDPSQLKFFALVAADPHVLLVDGAGLDLPQLPPCADRLKRHVAVVTRDEECLPLIDRRQECEGAEVAVVDPQIVLGDRGNNLVQQRSLLGVAIFAGKHIADQTPVGVQYDQALARQGSGRDVAQLLDPVVAGGDTVAIEYLGMVARRHRLQPAVHLVDQRHQFASHITDQCL